jgi:hypothetical protein
MTKFHKTYLVYQRNLFYLVLIFVFTACQEVIDLDLKNVEAQLVIEGKITDNPAMNEIKITTTVDFDDANEFPPILDAVVKVTDETAGITEVLEQTFPGVYTIQNIQGIPEHQYRMEVMLKGKTYTAVSKMPQKVALEAVSYEESARLHETKIQAVAAFTDPTQEQNNYRFVTFGNGIPSRTFFVRNDLFNNGNYVRQTIIDDNIDIQKGDIIKVQMQCLDVATFEYFRGLMILQGNNINQGASPSNPVSNISGGCLGYFGAYTVEEKEVLVE